MTGEIAQLISLTAHGNHWLRTGGLPAEYYPGNSGFKFCNTVDFREVEGRNELLVAIDPIFWFRYLQHEGCRMLRLYYHPAGERPPAREHQLAGFVGGGGIWLIEAIHDRHSNFWSGRWQVTQQEDPDRRIWCVNYGRARVNLPTVNLQFDLAAAAAEFRAALDAIIAFAREIDQEFWADFFQKAAAHLTSDTPGEGYHYGDIVPGEEYELEARRVLYAAGAAWAFGGMGSWNDLYIQDPGKVKPYDEVTVRTYDSSIKAILAAVNSGIFENPNLHLSP